MNGLGLACFVGLGGAAGTLLRYGIGRWTAARDKPAYYGTLTVNLVGSLTMGALIGIGLEQRDAAMYAFAGIGVLGGLTTYSTLNVQKATLIRGGSAGRRTLVYYLIATYAGGLAMTAAGYGLAYLFHH